jgi:hypothetical protein
VPAAGTVSITPLGGSADVETLDANGHYSHAFTTVEEEFAVVETITGGPTITYTVKALPGAAVSTSKDVGGSGVLADVENQAAHQANIATADATDLASAEALANATKAAFNALLGALAAAGIMA